MSKTNISIFICHRSAMRLSQYFLTGCFILALLGASFVGFSQNLNTNITWTAQKPVSTESDMIAPHSPQDVVKATEFIDGFGRLVEKNIYQGTPTAQDLIDFHVYDATGRETQKYLPFSSGNSGNFMAISTAITNQTSYCQTLYAGEANFYEKTDFENSPLNRTLKTYGAGSSWVGSSRGVQTQYLMNTSVDNVQIWNIQLAQGVLPTSAGAYPAKQLYKTITTNEQGVQTIEYKDMDNHVVLKKVQLTAAADNGTGSPHTNWLCNYYVYDDYGNLRFVITPKVVQQMDQASSWSINQTTADELCYRTEYDLLNRPVIKKTPGSGEQWIVYDQRGRIVMTQDANLRTLHKWVYFQFDGMDRPVSSGLMTDQSNYNNLSYHQGNAAISTSYPDVTNYSPELLTQTFYDNYAWAATAGVGIPNTMATMDLSNTGNTSYFSTPTNSSYPYPQPITQTAMTRGMTTGTKTEVLGTNGANYLYTTSFYDDKGRIVQSQSTNITGGIDKNTAQYSWDGKLLSRLQQHVYSNTVNPQSHNVVTKNTYNAMGQLTKITKTVNSTINGVAVSNAVKTIAAYSYDDFGRRILENLGPNVTPLETRGYTFNVRGWLLGINRSYVRGVTQASTTNSGEMFTTQPLIKAGQYFGIDLCYDKTSPAMPLPNNQTYANPQYSGNIAGMVWKLANDGQVRKYDFTYDNANQLLSADFNQYNPISGNAGAFDKSCGVDYSVGGITGSASPNYITYDYNGNIQAMQQKGLKTATALQSVPIDQLTYTYYPGTNRLQQVADAANDNTSKLGDFKYDPATKDPTTDYTYDNNGSGNGNLISDGNRKISSIQYYNVLNLPQTMTITGEGTVTYVYDAAGNKLSKTTVDNTNPAKTTVTNYISGFIYQNDVLQYFAHEEGRVRLKPAVGSTAASFVLDYFLKDHLGNVRMVLTDDPLLAKNPILETTSYYPMGLPMAMLNNRAGGTLHNNFGYQSKEMQEAEFNDGSGIQQIDFDARYYDHQLGVWHNQDPAGQFPSPYMAMGNNWVNGTDQNGELFGVDDLIVSAAGFLVGFGQSILAGHANLGQDLLAGAEGAAIAEVGYLTLGGGATFVGAASGSTAISSLAIPYAASYAATSAFTFAQNADQIENTPASSRYGLFAGYDATSAISAGFNSNATQKFIDKTIPLFKNDGLFGGAFSQAIGGAISNGGNEILANGGGLNSAAWFSAGSGFVSSFAGQVAHNGVDKLLHFAATGKSWGIFNYIPQVEKNVLTNVASGVTQQFFGNIFSQIGANQGYGGWNYLGRYTVGNGWWESYINGLGGLASDMYQSRNP